MSKKQKDIYKEICKAIFQDEKDTINKEDFITVEDYNERFITVYDEYHGYMNSRRYTIRNPKKIDEKYLSSLILISDDAKKLNPTIDIKKVIAYLDKLDKNMLMTVQRICFITNEEEDTDTIYQDELFAEGIEAGHGINDNQIGITWWDMDIILINLKAIQEISKEFSYDKYDFQKEYNLGILTTIVHEIRHCAQENPYLEEKYINPLSIDPEADAEEYARNYVDNHHQSILAS